MFYNNANNNGASSETMMSMMRNLQTPPFVSPMDTNQASIIKNENGMYTIRNPAFQSMFSGGGSGGGYSNAYNPPPGYVTPQTTPSSATSGFSPYESEYNNQAHNEMPKCSSVIGSEMKNVLQRRKEQEYMDWNQGMRSQYSHFGGMNFNGNNCDESGFGGNRPARPSSSGSGSCYPSYSSPTMTNYDELRLQPGKMLNSEVKKVDLIFIN